MGTWLRGIGYRLTSGLPEAFDDCFRRMPFEQEPGGTVLPANALTAALKDEKSSSALDPVLSFQQFGECIAQVAVAIHIPELSEGAVCSFAAESSIAFHTAIACFVITTSWTFMASPGSTVADANYDLVVSGVHLRQLNMLKV